MKFLASLERKAASVAQRASVPMGLRGQTYQTNWSTQRAVRDGYERNIWVFRCVNAIASTASRLDFLLHKADDEAKTYDDPLLKLLNQRPNPSETARAFKYRVSAQLLLSKAGVFVEVLRNRDGSPRELHLLPPHMTAPIPDPNTFVSGFKVQIGGTAGVVIAPENVVWIRVPHPIDPYLSSTPLESAGLSVDMDWYARIYNRNFMMNDGRPGGVLNVKGQLDPADEAEIKRRFSGGPSQAGRTSVLNAEDVTYEDMSVSPRDAQYTQTRASTKEETLIAFGSPESVLGNASGRTWDNADAEEEIWWRVTMLGHLETVAQPFDSLTAGGEDDDLHLEHDVSGVTVLTRAKREAERVGRARVAAGVATIDEYRVENGEDPFDVDATQTLYYPAIGALLGKSGEENVNPTSAAVGASTLLLSRIITINEARKDYGLPPLPDGDRLLTLEEIAALTGRGMTPMPGGGGSGPSNPTGDTSQGAPSSEPGSEPGSADNAPSALAPAPADQPTKPKPPVPTAEPEVTPDSSITDAPKGEPPVVPPRIEPPMGGAGQVKSDDAVDPMERWHARLDRWETAVGDVIKRLLERHRKVTLARLRGPKSRKDTRHWDPPGTKALDPKRVVDDERWQRELHDDVHPVVAQMMTEAARDTYDQLDAIIGGLPKRQWRVIASRPRKDDDPALETKEDEDRSLQERIGAIALLIAGTATTFSESVREQIAELDEQGLTVTAIEEAVEQRYAEVIDMWAERSAKTSVIGGVNSGSLWVAQQVAKTLVEQGRLAEDATESALSKRWRTVGDENVRPAHAGAATQEPIGLLDAFDVGGWPMDRPGDDTAPEELVIGCRCWLEYGVELGLIAAPAEAA